MGNYWDDSSATTLEICHVTLSTTGLASWFATPWWKVCPIICTWYTLNEAFFYVGQSSHVPGSKSSIDGFRLHAPTHAHFNLHQFYKTILFNKKGLLKQTPVMHTVHSYIQYEHTYIYYDFISRALHVCVILFDPLQSINQCLFGGSATDQPLM